MSAYTPDRRRFIKTSIAAALGGATLGSPLGQLALIGQASAQQAPWPDYRALVCVFLYGGNDGFNTIVPYGPSIARQRYENGRPTLKLDTASLLPLSPAPGGAASDGCAYGMPTSAQALATLFDSGRAAVLCNVGTLRRPTTKPDVQTPGFALPPQLYSHNDQQTYWQTCGNNQGLGWGGRMADLLYSGNANQVLPMTMTVAGESSLLRGGTVSQYGLNASGISAVTFVENSASRRALFDALIAPGAQQNALERAYAQTARRTLSNYAILSEALAVTPAPVTAFPATILGRQLRMVAHVIAARNALGMQRQMFFVQVGGYDTHAAQLADHPLLLQDLATSMAAFHAATQELGVEDQATAFTASDFGRTLSSNGDGSDHGWGSHHLIVGGAVRGRRFYGQMPDLSSNGPLDAGWGQIIPTTSVEQYAATLGAWMGIGLTELDDIFPNLARFPVANLGFMA